MRSIVWPGNTGRTGGSGDRVLPAREVLVETATGKVPRSPRNDLDAPIQDIAGLYKRLWAIELFSRWIKRILKIRRCLGTSENAVRTQIAVA